MVLLLLVMSAVCAASAGSLSWGGQSGGSVRTLRPLPVFQHAPEPLVSRELFRPVPQRSAVPPGLEALLLPPAQAQRAHLQPGPSPSGAVDLWCGLRSVGVRVDRLRLRHWSVPGLFRLSSCPVSAATTRYLYFHRGLGECGCDVQVLRGQLVYHFSLSYAAPQGSVLRVPPLDLPLSCLYNRFHYSYRVGYQPLAPPSSFMKSMQSRASFSLSICNSHWEAWPPGQELVLGEPVYLVARVGVILPGETLYMDACRVTSSEDPESSPRLDLITNHGCMTDSAQAHSGSRFVWRGSGELRFSVDSLLFSSEPKMMFLHCSMSLALHPSPSSKSCSYSRDTGRWQELEPSFSSVCSCCDSVCGVPEDPVKPWVSSFAFHLTHHNKVQPFMKNYKTGSTEEQQEALKIHKAGHIEQQEEAVKIHKAGHIEQQQQQEEAVKIHNAGHIEQQQQAEALKIHKAGHIEQQQQEEEAVEIHKAGHIEQQQQAEALKIHKAGHIEQQQQEEAAVEIHKAGLIEQQQEEAVKIHKAGLIEQQQEEAVKIHKAGLIEQQQEEAVKIHKAGLIEQQQEEAVKIHNAGLIEQQQEEEEAVKIHNAGHIEQQQQEEAVKIHKAGLIEQQQEEEEAVKIHKAGPTEEKEQEEAVSMRSRGAGGALTGEQQVSVRRTGAQVQSTDPEGNIQGQSQEPEGNIQGQSQEPEGNIQGQSQGQSQDPERSIQGQSQEPERNIQGQNQEPERSIQSPSQGPERSIQGQSQDPSQDPERNIQSQNQEPESQPLDQTPVNPLENRTSTGPNT